MAGVAPALGARAPAVALLSRPPLREFETREAWDAFAAKWRETLRAGCKPRSSSHRLQVGIENHKDWRAAELVELLPRVGSPRSAPAWTSATTSRCSRIRSTTIERWRRTRSRRTSRTWPCGRRARASSCRRCRSAGHAARSRGMIDDAARGDRPDAADVPRDDHARPAAGPVQGPTVLGRASTRRADAVASRRVRGARALARPATAPLPRVTTGWPRAEQVAAEDENVRRSIDVRHASR